MREGQLPPGFLAIDLAEALGLPLHEPSVTGAAVDYKSGKHPRRASAILGQDSAKPDVVVAVNGGNDLFPARKRQRACPEGCEGVAGAGLYLGRVRQ